MEICKRVVLHNPILLGGVNLNMRLDEVEKAGLRILNDQKNQMVYASYKGEVVKLPHTAVAQIFPRDAVELKAMFSECFEPKAEEVKAKPGPKPKLSAQAQTPNDHVHAGLGAGKTRD